MKFLPGMNISWKRVFNIILKMSHDTKTMDFQYKAVYDVLAINYRVCQWKIKESNLCTFSNEAVETQLHSLRECNKIHNIWLSVNSKIVQFFNQNTLSDYDVRLGTDNIEMCKIIFITERYII